jgi:RNA polymerase sigma-70 factor (ECF subfamily)
MLSFFQKRKFNTVSDEELVVLYKKNKDKQCIAILFERYGHFLLAIAMKYCKNKQDAEDIVMDLFEKLGEKLVKHDIQNFKSWLHTTIRNECLMVLRKRKPEFQLEESHNAKDHLFDTDQQDDIKEKERILDELEIVISKLKEEQKKCVTLFFLEQKSYIEIAQGLSLSLNQVKSAIQNGKRMLKIQMENYIQKNRDHEIESK